MSMLANVITWLISSGPKLKQAYELIMLLYELFKADIEAATGAGGVDSGLEMTQLSTQEAELVDQLTASLSADGTQAAIDLTRLRRIANWLDKVSNSPLGSAIIAILKSSAGAPG